jgi:hypothetical protein
VTAGFLHAAYSTDGYDVALLSVDERSVLRDVIGSAAEELVYRYGATTRALFYRQLGQSLVVWTDRFTGASLTLDPVDVAPLVELTVANELDVVLFADAVPDGYRASLLGLLTRARSHMSDLAWEDVTSVLAA